MNHSKFIIFKQMEESICLQGLNKFSVSGHNPDLLPYSDMFLENHISGKLLLNLTVDNLQNLGIKSLGHALDLFVSMVIIIKFLTFNFDLRSRDCGLEPHGKLCVVSLSKTLYLLVSTKYNQNFI